METKDLQCVAAHCLQGHTFISQKYVMEFMNTAKGEYLRTTYGAGSEVFNSALTKWYRRQERKGEETVNGLIKIANDGSFPVDGRNLHAQLGVETPYHKWFPRMCEYGFMENVDFKTTDKNVRRADGTLMPQIQKNHMLTLSMAKEICMLQRTEQGRAVRRYLIEIENQWNQPEAVMARALQMADRKIAEITGQMQQIRADNSRLAVENQIMEPKAAYFDELVDRGVNLSIREAAKQIGAKERSFIDFLIEHKYIYRDQKGKLMPYAQHTGDLFVLKECFNEKTAWGGTQTLVTPKGRETFRLLTQGLTA